MVRNREEYFEIGKIYWRFRRDHSKKDWNLFSYIWRSYSQTRHSLRISFCNWFLEISHKRRCALRWIKLFKILPWFMAETRIYFVKCLRELGDRDIWNINFRYCLINDAIPRQNKISWDTGRGLQKQQERGRHRWEGEHEFHLNRIGR